MKSELNKNIIQVEAYLNESSILSIIQTITTVFDQRIEKLLSPEKDDPFITRQDVAKIYHITLPTVHSWMNAGILKPYKIGNKTRFLLSEVKAAALPSGGKKGGLNE